MSALARLSQLLSSDGADKTHLAGRSMAQAIEGSDKIGFIAMGVIALCSFVAAFGLLSFLTYRFIFWRRYYKRPLAENQYVLLIYNLLIVDIQQAIAFLLCLHWISKGHVYYPSVPCVLQGWWIQTGDPGSGLFVLAIALHTGAVVLRGHQLPYPIFVACIIGLWAFIIVLGLIPVGMFGAETFVISEAGWCWIGPDHETERLWVHYLWIFLSEFGTIILYGVMFFYLRTRMKQAATLRQGQQENLKRLNRVVVYMVIYPLVYLVLSLPLAAGRMSTARHIIPSRAYFAVAGSLMALSGLVDVLVYTLTRRHLLLETELTTTDRLYAYTESNAYQTHITTGRDGKNVRNNKKSKFRRGMQSMNDTVNDNRDSSTDDIVRKTDMELADLGHGVYQETTIEISHEPADPEEFQKRGRHSG
ncbi:family A G protein-coupled receptor-like protein [Aspergillus heteromorphus CBS 117.55]|uniref:Family A G protein-coupled receptor-like protein n=1 Tax=Aspergillus heteromorphus CBS 117.55 TaxID=1448321 RepID=A0A317VKF8_9EURO|nr:family A G protein-coupled receptor-like protein [Aspergillus heteromorphus CBS 117.55]PWY74385.1 family A G protein-coupled receptor-like protein [Aspergillus heteromorphus CBS 117.55]